MTQSTKSRALVAIFWAGLVAGTMDITAAFVTLWPQGISPFRILKGIAAGLLGPEAYAGGRFADALGLACHFFIAYSAATVFYLASRRISLMTRRPILSGALYGVCVYVVMYWIVVPLSRLHRWPRSIKAALIAIVIHIVCVGLPISLIVRRFSRE